MERGYSAAGHACANCRYRHRMRKRKRGEPELWCWYDREPVAPAACCGKWEPAAAPRPADEINRLHGKMNELAGTALATAVRIGELLKAECGCDNRPKGWGDDLAFDGRTARDYVQAFDRRGELANVSWLAAAYRLLAGESRTDAICGADAAKPDKGREKTKTKNEATNKRQCTSKSSSRA